MYVRHEAQHAPGSTRQCSTLCQLISTSLIIVLSFDAIMTKFTHKCSAGIMDDSVLAAMARWPDVPDVYGWLSLSEQGQWRLHPEADALQCDRAGSTPFTTGESIDNAQLRAFMDRNYACDHLGRWYFQNGPQRVFIRLDAAPYILHADSAAPTLRTHNGLAVTRIDHWWIDDSGRLYATTEHGPGLIAGRDTPLVFEALRTLDGPPLIEALESFDMSALEPQPAAWPIEFQSRDEAGQAAYSAAPLRFCRTAELAAAMGFVPCPAP